MSGMEWWRSAVIYQVYPRSFADTDGDGIGDLPGVTAHLSYLADLGVDAIWLSPFYPSAHEDGGYDITDFTDVDPLFGSLTDFDELVSESHRRGLRVLVDLVPNHTSRHHPWFREARSSLGAPRRDWYIWRDPAPDGGPPNNWRAISGGPAWTLDEATGQYYLHSFFAAQPDLNWRNPKVREAIQDAMRFWLGRGVDGFRLDMIDYLIKDAEFRDEPVDGEGRYDWPTAVHQLNQPEVVDVMRELRQVTDAYPDRVLLGEIEYRLPVDKMASYYGPDLDALQMPFNFWLLFLPWEAASLESFVAVYEASLPTGAWPNWVLGNHDVPRPATRLGVESARAAMLLMLTLRGTPVIYYGDEIGMVNVPVAADQVQDPWATSEPGSGRDAERTPMRWTPGPNAGFSRPNATPWLPIGDDVELINVETESRQPRSILSMTRALLALRRTHPALSTGDYETVASPDGVIAFWRRAAGERFLVAVNTSPEPAVLRLEAGISGVVRVSTGMDRDRTRIDSVLTLSGHEACVVEAAPS
jgi:alpha-glucosidase